MTGLFEAAKELQNICQQRGWRFWGEPRVTRDLDLTLLTGFGREEEYIQALLGAYAGRINDARDFALRHRVLLLKTQDGIGIDVSLGALSFEAQMIDRATSFSFAPGLDILTCSAEDLIVLSCLLSAHWTFTMARGSRCATEMNLTGTIWSVN